MPSAVGAIAPGAEPVLIINDVAAARFFKDQDPLGAVVESNGKRTIVGIVRAAEPGKPIFVMGHSMGGAIVALTVAEKKPAGVQGMILSAPVLNLGVPPFVLSAIRLMGTVAPNLGVLKLDPKAFSTNPAKTGTFEWDTESKLMTFTPSTAFAYSTPYTITLGTGAMDLADNALATAKVFTFTTAAEPDTTKPYVTSFFPAASAIGVMPAMGSFENDPSEYETAPRRRPSMYTGLPLIPAMTPVCASGPPSNFARIRFRRGPMTFRSTPMMWTLNSSSRSPSNTVRPTAVIPGRTSSSG